MQPTGDHQMNHEPSIAVHADRDPFTDAANFSHRTSFELPKLRIGSTQ